MVSVLDLMTLWLEMDSVEDLVDFGFAGANPADYSVNFPVDPIFKNGFPSTVAFGISGRPAPGHANAGGPKMFCFKTF